VIAYGSRKMRINLVFHGSLAEARSAARLIQKSPAHPSVTSSTVKA
jgi:hypothetical protein